MSADTNTAVPFPCWIGICICRDQTELNYAQAFYRAHGKDLAPVPSSGSLFELKPPNPFAVPSQPEASDYPYDALFQAIGDSLDSTVKIAGASFSISVKAFVESIRAQGFDIVAASAPAQPQATHGFRSFQIGGAGAVTNITVEDGVKITADGQNLYIEVEPAQMETNDNAARYRWLKANVRSGSVGFPGGVIDTERDEWDQVIDAARMAAKPCHHRIVDARNPIIKSGYICIDCGALFAAADHDAPKG